MDAALKLFIAKGVGPTTIEQITAGASVAKGTFYLHFNSKEEVLDALRERFVKELLDGIASAVSAEDDWRGRLEAWAKASVEGYLDALPLHDVVFKQPHAEPRENILVSNLAMLLAEGNAARAWYVEDARFTAVFLFHGYHAVLNEAVATDKRINRARLSRKLAAQFFQAVGLRQ
jgi:AcrR family transcriptional regulator